MAVLIANRFSITSGAAGGGTQDMVSASWGEVAGVLTGPTDGTINAATSLRMQVGAVEGLRIDSSLRFFVGKSSTGLANVGFEWNADKDELYLTSDQQAATGAFTYAKHASYDNISYRARVLRTANSAYDFFLSESNNGADVEHKLKGDGNGTCDGSWTGGGADRAEFMEWEDGNPSNEDRRGFTVVNIGNRKMRQATQADKDAGIKIFAISSNPDSVGNAAPFRWAKKYLRDQFGAYDLDEKGNRKPNPEYKKQPYKPRGERKEWLTVTMSGFTPVRVDQVISDNWIEQSVINKNIKEYLVS